MRWCKNKQKACLNTEVVKSWEEVWWELKGAEEKEYWGEEMDGRALKRSRKMNIGKEYQRNMRRRVRKQTEGLSLRITV